MLNPVKSPFTVPSPRSEAKALVEAFARQDKQRVYPFALQNFTLGVRFQNADPQTQRVIVMTMLAWLDQHPLKSCGPHDQNEWQMVWKVREAFLHMLQFKIPFQEKDVIAMLHWSASQSSAAAYIYFSGIPQIIKVVGDHLKNHPMTDELHQAIDGLAQCIESGSMSVEVRRWILRLKELMGETQVSLPLVAGDAWADTAMKEIYAMNSRAKTAWAELLRHCAEAADVAPTRRWLADADSHIDAIGDLYLFIKLSHWLPLASQPQASSANAAILHGLVWLCSKSEDPEVAHALAGLAAASYKARIVKLGNACLWSLANMPVREGKAQLHSLKDKITNSSAQKKIARVLESSAA